MPRPAKYITIKGQFANRVLGTFRIICGFATLQDLATISAPFPMNLTPAADQILAGHQRAIDPAHADAIKRYLQDGNSSRWLSIRPARCLASGAGRPR